MNHWVRVVSQEIRQVIFKTTRGDAHGNRPDATERLKEILGEAQKLKAVTYKPDNFGRWLVELFVVTDDGQRVQSTNNSFSKATLSVCKMYDPLIRR